MTNVGDRLAAEAEAAELAEAMTDQNAPLPEGNKVTRGHPDHPDRPDRSHHGGFDESPM